MVSTFSNALRGFSVRTTRAPQLLVYYAQVDVDALRRALQGGGRVALQPDACTDAQLAALRRADIEPLAYLSLGEDTGPSAPWQRDARNAEWGGSYVTVSEDWCAHVLVQASQLLARGFNGFLLDTLDTVDLFPEERAPLLALVRRLREQSAGHYLLANRGFRLFPELAQHVDGLLFESFSSTWQDGYRAHAPRDLLYNAEALQRLGRPGSDRLDLYALDYALTGELAAFARARAKTHGLVSLISNRDLTTL